MVCGTDCSHRASVQYPGFRDGEQEAEPAVSGSDSCRHGLLVWQAL